MPREAPPRNTVYTGMLAVSLGAVLVGCVILGLELTSDYDWTLEAKGGPPVNIPAKSAVAPAAAPGAGAAVIKPGPTAVAAAEPQTPPTTPATVPNPLPNPAVAIAPPAPIAPAPRPVVVAEPAKPAAGLTPSTFKLPGDR